jgi:drug/metabolite transporter (DMT)-like permease
VQAGRSSSLAVTAVLAVLMIGARLKGRDMLAIVAVGAGLIAVAVSSRHGRAHLVLDGWALALPVVVVVLLLWGGQVLSRRRDPWVGSVLALLAGAAFVIVGLCVRALAGSRGLDGTELLTHPLLWTLPLAGFAGLHLSTLALTESSVVAVTSVLIASEVVVAGHHRCHPRRRSRASVRGLGWLAVAGCCSWCSSGHSTSHASAPSWRAPSTRRREREAPRQGFVRGSLVSATASALSRWRG